ERRRPGAHRSDPSRVRLGARDRRRPPARPAAGDPPLGLLSDLHPARSAPSDAPLAGCGAGRAAGAPEGSAAVDALRVPREQLVPGGVVAAGDELRIGAEELVERTVQAVDREVAG